MDAPEPRRISNVADVTSRRTLKTTSTVADNNNGLGRSFSKNSLDMAIRHMVRLNLTSPCSVDSDFWYYARKSYSGFSKFWIGFGFGLEQNIVFKN